MKGSLERAPIILASASPSRAALLREAGLKEMRIVPSGLDEGLLKESHRGEPPQRLASALAEAKGLSVSEREREAFVIAADQLLDFEGARLDKPRDEREARAHLLRLRGRAHRLVGSVVLARQGEILWRYESEAHMTMRAFTPAFLEAYLAQSGSGILKSVGGYCLEGLGAHLFEKIEGDYFSILGLPLLPLLSALRKEGALLR